MLSRVAGQMVAVALVLFVLGRYHSRSRPVLRWRWQHFRALALAGPLIAWSLNGALWAAVAVTLLAAVFPILVIPSDDHR